MTTAATTDLAACLALVSEAAPGPWTAINSIPEEGVECFWIKTQPGGGICRGFTQEIGCVNGPQSDEQEANARLIPAAVNYLRTHGDTLQRALALLAAVESGEAFGAWQTIETAPMDGTHVLAYVEWRSMTGAKQGQHDVICWWDSDLGFWTFPTAVNYVQSVDPCVTPTHWMPLPAAPAAPGAEE